MKQATPSEIQTEIQKAEDLLAHLQRECVLGNYPPDDLLRLNRIRMETHEIIYRWNGILR